MRHWNPVPSDPGPKPVASSLDRVTSALGGPSAAALAAVFGRWADLVGEGLAAHCHPASLRDGTLVVVADEPARASALRWLEADLLAKLADALGEGQVRALEVRVAAEERAPARPPAPDARPPSRADRRPRW